MRPGQNKRMRGRNNNNSGGNRKGPNPLTRSYESNGPDVKIRGTAHHIGEKYLQLARDAQSSGDPVMAESYLQHAEHYFRLIAAAQQAQQQAQFGYQRQPGEQIEQDEDNDDDFDALPDRFASPSEQRPPQPVQPQPQPHQPQPYAERQPYQNGGDRQPYEQRPDRQQGERQGGYERPYDNRNNRGDRQSYQDRGYQNRNGQDRNQDRAPQERANHDRGPQDRGQQEAGQGGRDDRPARDYDNRNFRGRNRDFRDGSAPREPRQPAIDESGNGLPAFITAPTRTQPETSEPQPTVEGSSAGAPASGDEAGFALRPRRRRRAKPDFAGEPSEGESKRDIPASDPVGE